MTWFQRNASDLRWLIAIFLVAFVVRLAYVGWNSADPTNDPNTDAYFYHHSAKAMVLGRGYIFPGHLGEGTPEAVYGGAATAYWPPGYTATLAGTYKLPGPDMGMAKGLNVTLGALTCCLVYLLGRFMWGRTVGVAAAAMLTFFPSHIFYSALLLTETTYAFLISLILLLVVVAIQQRRASNVPLAIAVGLLCGATTLVRGETLLVPIVTGIAVWLASSLREAVRFTAVVALGVAVVLGAWTIRNLNELDAPIPINTGSSVVLSLGHWEGADGGGNKLRAAFVQTYYKEEFYPGREVKGYRKRTREAIEYWATHPAHEAELIPRRLFELYRHDHDAIDWVPVNDRPLNDSTLDVLRWVCDIYYVPVLVLAALGVTLWWRARRVYALLLLGLVVYVTALISLVFFGDQRYHAVLIPAFCLLAAPALARVLPKAVEEGG